MNNNGNNNFNNSQISENLNQNNQLSQSITKENQYNNIGNKNRKNLTLIILAGIIVILSIIAISSLKNLKNKNETNNNSITKATSFFLFNAEGNYALFNDDGKRLTDFIYSDAKDFINGTSLVEKGDAYGIIDMNGKNIVDFGKYSRISSAAGIYRAETDENNEVLIDGKGKILYNLKDKQLLTFSNCYFSILKDEVEKTYRVLDSQGQTLTNFPIVENAADEPYLNEKDGYIFIYYNNKNIVLDKNGKEITSFNNSLNYCVTDIIKDGAFIILKPCKKEENYKIIKEDKVYDLNDKCNYVSYENNYFLCSKGDNKYILDENFDVKLDVTNNMYVDMNNYAQDDEEPFKGVNFYKNNKLVKNVECRSQGTMGNYENGLYILETFYSTSCKTDVGIYEFYNTNGEKAIDKSFAYAEKFDKNNNAKVSEDKTNYYLIDIKGNKISDVFNDIIKSTDYTNNRDLISDYYIVTKDNLTGAIDKNGKQIIDCKYSDVNITNKNGKYYADLTTTDYKHIFYDISQKKEILKSDVEPILNEHYILITKSDGKQYYLYNGKLFYENKYK